MVGVAYCRNKIYRVRGKAGTISDLARHFRMVSPAIAVQRVSRHAWDIEKAVTTAQIRHTKTYEAFGESGDLTSLVAKFSSVGESTVRARLQYGWSLEDALTKGKVTGEHLVNAVTCPGCDTINHIASKSCKACSLTLPRKE